MTNVLPEALKTFRQDFDVRVFVDRNKGDWHMPMEWHTSLEVFVCIAGKGKYQIGEKHYSFEAGDIFVINNGELHKSEIYENGAFDAFIVMFSAEKMFPQNILMEGRDLLDVFYNRKENFSHQYRPDAKQRQIYESVCKLMLKEYEEKKMGYKESVKALLIWLLIELNRQYLSADEGDISYTVGEKIKHKKIISEVLNYVDRHYKEEIVLGELAEKLYVNQSYLSREFKKETGYSMVKFITNKRIREARNLLRDTDMLITEIAITVGYNNITHFNAMFKKETGISPKEFRNRIHGKV